tara:strand:- start:996 stop:2309 length:1314 start_codon:yes stop_codon:yes gene_type:complete
LKYFLNKFIKAELKPNFYFFYLGLFLLPSAFPIAAILLLISIIYTNVLSRKEFLKDQWNLPFLFGSFFMLISSFVHTFHNEQLINYNLDSSLTWVGLANWIPFFICFWGFQPYLNSSNLRKIACLILLSGSLPVLITGIGQSLFGWYGPFEAFNGLIIWYQRPYEGIHAGLTGLFNNQNYAGVWLNIIWPFCIASGISARKNIVEKTLILSFMFSITLCTILTNSRSAWLGIIIGTLLMLREKSYKFFISLILIVGLIITSTIIPIFGESMQNFLKILIPKSIWMEFSDFQFSRLEIWKSAINSILTNPIFGTGGGSFSKIFRYETGLWKGHAHNLPLEFTVSYGIIAGLFVFLPIIFLVYLSLRKIVLNMKFKKFSITLYDKAWIASLLIILISQMVDVQYFDGRISIVFWLLLSGSKNFVSEVNIVKKFRRYIET